jgi:hypothetical protein
VVAAEGAAVVCEEARSNRFVTASMTRWLGSTEGEFDAIHSFPVRVGVGIALVALVVGTIAVAHVRARQAAPVTSSVPQAAPRVPLEYRYSITTPRGVLRYVEYRAADGSVMRDTVGHDELQILSIPRRAFYQRRNGAWTESPMRPQPPVMQVPASNTTAVPGSDSRVQLVSAAAGMPVTFLEWSTGPAHHVIYCPELDMLEVWSRQGEGDSLRVRELTSLVMGEPNVSFAPPEGAEVKHLDQPAGPGLVTGSELERLRSAARQ